MLWKRRQTAGRVIATDFQAGQGPRGRPILMVLLGSIALLGIYLAAMMLWAASTSPVSPRDPISRQEPAVVPSSALNTNDPPAANPAYPVPAVPSVK